MGRERIQTRADEDTAEAVAEYRESEDTPELTQAEAVRRLVRAGLALKGYPVAGHSDLAKLSSSDDSDVIVGKARMAGNLTEIVGLGTLMLLVFLGIGLATGAI